MKHNALAITLIVIGIGLVGFVFFQEEEINIPNTPDISNVTNKTLPSGEVLLDDAVYSPPAFLEDGVNKLVIEKIGVEAEILEGGEDVLAEGVWHLPRTANPADGGNTVISAHRWKYKPPDPRTFYDLDKLEVGDEIIVTWDNSIYIYIVNNIFEVASNEVDILSPSDNNKLTLFTCTPLYSTDRRLVVQADLESIK